jgi:CheY-like chemotaxis protein
MRILVMDGNEETRFLLRLLMEANGHEVIEAADGEAGVQTALTKRPDLILLDLLLPKLDACEATRLIRQSPRLSELPIVAYSLRPHEPLVVKALEAGVTDFVALDPDALLNSLIRYEVAA